MKYCPECNRRFKDKEGFCSSCGIRLQNIPKQQRSEKTQKEKDKSTYLGIAVIVLIIILLMGTWFGIQSQQPMNPGLQQVILNQKVDVKVMIDNDSNIFWILYIDGMSTGNSGNGDNLIIKVQLTKEYHKFELQDGDGTVFDSYGTNINGGEEILLTI